MVAPHFRQSSHSCPSHLAVCPVSTAYFLVCNENIKEVIIIVTISIRNTITISVTVTITISVTITIDNGYLLQENLVTTLILDEDVSRGSRSRNQTILDIFDTIYTKYFS